MTDWTRFRDEILRLDAHVKLYDPGELATLDAFQARLRDRLDDVGIAVTDEEDLFRVCATLILTAEIAEGIAQFRDWAPGREVIEARFVIWPMLAALSRYVPEHARR